MKFLQTHGPAGQTGIQSLFFYRRVPGYVEIYPETTETPSSAAPDYRISNDEWDKILASIGTKNSFTMSDANPGKGLYGLLRRVSHYGTHQMARIAAILAHESSIELHDRGKPINLRSDQA